MTKLWYGFHQGLSDLHLRFVYKETNAAEFSGDAEGVRINKGTRNLRMTVKHFRTLKAVSHVL